MAIEHSYFPIKPVTPVPTSVTAIAVKNHSDQIQVKWAFSMGATAYEIWRSQSEKQGYVKITTLSADPLFSRINHGNILQQTPSGLQRIPVDYQQTASGFETTVARYELAVPTSFVDSGLSPGTMYYYQIVANGKFGASKPSSPPASATTYCDNPQGITVQPTSSSTMLIEWQMSINAISYVLYRDPPFPSVGVDLKSSSNLFYKDTSLSPGTTYCYRVYAKNSAGAIYFGPTKVCATLPYVPQAPTGVGARGWSQTEIVIEWDHSPDVVSWEVSRATSSSGWAPIGSSTSNQYDDYGLTPGMTYYYKVVAINSTGEKSPSSDVASATTYCYNPQGVIVHAISSSEIVLEWQSALNADGYIIFRDPPFPNTLVGTDDVSFKDTGLSPATTYCYSVATVNSAGTVAYRGSEPSEVCATTPYISPPTNVVAQAKSATVIRITWQKPAGADTCTVLRSDSSAGPFGAIGTLTSSTTLDDKSLSLGTTYYYKVIASDSAGHTSDPSDVVSATTSLAPPTHVVAQATAPDQITVSWTPSTGATNATKYHVYCSSTSANGPYTQRPAMTTTGTSSTDTGLSAGMTYYYKVLAEYNMDESDLSNYVSATLPPTAPILNYPSLSRGSGEFYDKVTISWQQSMGASSYTVYSNHNLAAPSFPNAAWLKLGTVNAPTLEIDDHNFSLGVNWYIATASNSGGNSPPSNIMSVTASEN